MSLYEELFSEKKPDSLSELHDCEKCHGKIVSISLDAMGVTRCGYCGEIVDYISWFNKPIKELMKFSEENET